ncbi:MAG: sensor histidine kinase, partial [Lachnospiraceae bacterium]|nr:sensor histidine kinase [Lachnospiraceae bacterium]
KTEHCLTEGDEKEIAKLAELLRGYAARNSFLGSIYLVIPQAQLLITSQEYPMYQKNIPHAQLQQVKKAGSRALKPELMQDPLQHSMNILSFCSPVEDKAGRPLAYIMINIRERSLYYTYLDGFADGTTSEAALLDETGRIVSAKDSEQAGQLYEKQASKAQDDMEQAKSKDMISVAYRTDFFGYSFQIKKEKSEVLTDLNEIRFFLAVILLLVFGAGALVMIALTRAMYEPLGKLTETMELVSSGELEERVEITTNDEIGILSRDFNDMLNHIEDLIQKLVQEEILKKDAELEALQYQITPHFMYNTLNSIKYAALLKGEAEIGGLVEDFIELLQASIRKKGKFITVAEEVHLVENYLNLQRMRYEEPILVDYDIGDDTLDCFLPRLMFQPLVENAILHGLDLKNGKNRICIGGRVENGSLFLWVQDNGRGMSEEQLEQLLNDKKEKKNGLSGIGVANVRQRLQLYYGTAGGITCESSRKGTTIRMFLPAYQDREQYAL